MSQPLSNLSTEDTVEAPVKSAYQSLLGEKIVWQVAGQNHYGTGQTAMIPQKILALLAFDAPEPSNPNADRASNGNGRYAVANILQWLNSSKSEGNWYTAQHDYDTPPTLSYVSENPYADWAGFLYMLDDDFVASLLDFAVITKKVYEDGLGTETVTAKMQLPSKSETFQNEDGVEGSLFPLFSDNESRIAYPTAQCVSNSDWQTSGLDAMKPWNWKLRTGYSDSWVPGVSAGGEGSATTATSVQFGIRPVCSLSSTVKITDTVNADGNYEFVFAYVTAKSPQNRYIDGTKPQVFSWVTSGSYTQTKVQIQYSRTGSEWIDLISLDTTAQEYQFPANSLPTGSFHWRIRVGNDDGFLEEWSEPLLVIVQAAPAPVTNLSITSAARPVVAWDTNDQIAFQLQILQSNAILYDTGEAAGDAAGSTVTEYLFDGAYTLRIRVKNSSMLWSDWADQNFEIDTVKPNAPAVSVSTVPKGAVITATPDETITKMYLFRNGAPISKISGVYYDYSALGETTYFVRAIGVDDSFMDTAPASVTVTVPYAVLAAADDLQNTVDLKVRRGEYPTHSGRRQIIGTARHYAGRAFPLYTFSEFTEEELSPVFSFPDPADWTKLETLIYRRQTVLYRDRRGDRYYGVITGVDYDRDRIAWDFTLSITRVDYVERIDFDAPEV